MALIWAFSSGMISLRGGQGRRVAQAVKQLAAAATHSFKR
jgi:hypothetical protein